MVAPPTKKPKTNDQVLQPIQSHNHLVEDDDSDDSVLAEAAGLDDDSMMTNGLLPPQTVASKSLRVSLDRPLLENKSGGRNRKN